MIIQTAKIALLTGVFVAIAGAACSGKTNGDSDGVGVPVGLCLIMQGSEHVVVGSLSSIGAVRRCAYFGDEYCTPVEIAVSSVIKGDAGASLTAVTYGRVGPNSKTGCGNLGAPGDPERVWVTGRYPDAGPDEGVFLMTAGCMDIHPDGGITNEQLRESPISLPQLNAAAREFRSIDQCTSDAGH